MTQIVVALLLLTLAAVMGWQDASMRNLREARQLRAAHQTAMLAESAVQEALARIHRDAPRGGTAIGAAFRALGAGRAPIELQLPALAAVPELPGAAEVPVTVCARVEQFRASPDWPGTGSGTLAIEAHARGASPRRAGLRTAFRLQRVALPPPLDSWTLAPAGGANLAIFGYTRSDRDFVTDPIERLTASPAGDAALIALSDPSRWEAGEAAFRVEPGPDTCALQRFIAGRLAKPGGALDGIVIVSASSGPAQRLGPLTFRGRALVVVTGPVHSCGLFRPMPVGQGMTAATYVSDRAYLERRVDSRGIRWPDSAPYQYAICIVMLAVCNGLDRDWSWQGFRSDDADAIRRIVAEDDDRTAKTALSFLDHHGLLAAGPSDTPPPSPVVSAGTSGVVVQARALASQATQLVEEARSRGATLVRSDEYSRRYIGNLIDHALGTVESLRALTGHGSTPGENEELEVLYRPVAASYNSLARWWNTFNAP